MLVVFVGGTGGVSVFWFWGGGGGEGGMQTQQETGEFSSLSGPLAPACHKTPDSFLQFHIQPPC